MSTFALAAATSLAVIALGVAVVSLLLHWARGQEHPDVAQARSEILALRTDFMDLLDKVEHWRGRDNVRRARAGKEAKEQEAIADSAPDIRADRQAWKAYQRRRLAGEG